MSASAGQQQPKRLQPRSTDSQCTYPRAGMPATQPQVVCRFCHALCRGRPVVQPAWCADGGMRQRHSPLAHPVSSEVQSVTQLFCQASSGANTITKHWPPGDRACGCLRLERREIMPSCLHLDFADGVQLLFRSVQDSQAVQSGVEGAAVAAADAVIQRQGQPLQRRPHLLGPAIGLHLQMEERTGQVPGTRDGGCMSDRQVADISHMIGHRCHAQCAERARGIAATGRRTLNCSRTVSLGLSGTTKP